MSEEESPYFSMSEAYKEVSDAEGAQAKFLPGLKLAGKGIFNAGTGVAKALKFTFEEVLPPLVRHLANANVDQANERLKDKSLSDAERAKLVAVRGRAEVNLKKLDVQEAEGRKRAVQSELRRARRERLRQARLEAWKKEQAERGL